jgi:hypothetical protein
MVEALEEMGILALECLDMDVLEASVGSCVTFLDPRIDYGDIALVSFVSGQKGRILKTALILPRRRPA